LENSLILTNIPIKVNEGKRFCELKCFCEFFCGHGMQFRAIEFLTNIPHERIREGAGGGKTTVTRS
jgi:hypothetical protein